MINLQKDDPTHGLIVKVQFGGCHGFKYQFLWENLPNQNISTNFSKIESDQTKLSTSFVKKFYEQPSEMLHFIIFPEENLPVHVIIDLISFELINGATLHYVNELIGSEFIIMDNPQADTGCGCGVSFGLKQ